MSSEIELRVERELTVAKAILSSIVEKGACRQNNECRCSECFEYAREVLENAGETLKPRQRPLLCWENGFRD